MIKPIITEKTFPNNQIIPNYWQIMDDKQLPNINTKRIIPTSNDKGYFKHLILEAINSASKTIMLCSFILSDKEIINSLLKAAERKVRIYLLFSTNVQLDKEYNEDPSEYDKAMVDGHKDFLKRIHGKALARSSELHAKFLLVDYGLSNQKGFISTANFTNEALKRNQEVGIILNHDDLHQLFLIFQHGFWEESQQELSGDWLAIKERNLKVLPVSERILSTSKNNQSLKKKIIKLIESTSGPLIISSYSFKQDNDLTKKLITLSRTREITILTRPREANVTVLNEFLKNNATVYCYDYIHAKFILAPNDKKGLIMTANFDNKGIESGYEVGIYLDINEFEELNRICQNWIEYAQYKYEIGGDINTINPGKIKIYEGRNLTEVEIKKEKIIEEVEKPEDLRLMNKLQEISYNNNYTNQSNYYQRIIVKRTIDPPQLPPNSTQLKDNPFPVPLYIFKNKRYLLIKNEKQLQLILEKHGNKLNNVILVTDS
ncbi:MAG TPA: phospholipase D-like domain-containing protein [candidate division Zixibacteria bacterium]|nr:phospholipase D-like domain-containing protein [candidate division Zixibacteria bacterium]